MVAVVANLAGVLVPDVDPAVVDFNQAEIAVGRQPGELLGALHAQPLAVVQHAVPDAAGDAQAPVGRLRIPGGAVGAEVGSRDVAVAVGDAFQTAVVDQ